MLAFEYDQKKSLSNKQKHGLDFEEAQFLWFDFRSIAISARTVGEPRQLLIAELNGEIWSAIFTYRNNAIQIISVRKSKNSEKEIYFNRGI